MLQIHTKIFVDALNNTGNIENPSFHAVFKDVYPSKLILNKANLDDKKVCLVQHTVTTKCLTNFDLAIYPFPNRDVPTDNLFDISVSHQIC